MLFEPEATSPFEPHAQASGDKFRIFSWNLLHGGGRRLPEIAIALARLRADLVILCEFRRNPGASLRAVLADAGLTHQLCTAPESPSRTNGLLLAARLPFREIQSQLAQPRDRTRLAHVALADERLSLTAAHIPCLGRERHQSQASRRIWQSTLNTCKANTCSNHVVIGDLNADRDPAIGARTDPGAFRLGQLATLGYLDACTVQTSDAETDRDNPSPKPTWHGPNGERARLDYAWLSPSLAPKLACARAATELLDQRLSDHAGLEIDLDLTTPAP
ncbi:MAG: endonuclease/exonuclease/phosphatase family protein [Planctomycetota bacterium]